MSHKKSTDSFIIEANEKHLDLYDYSKVEYINVKTKVEIICRKHGSFFVTPNQHLSKMTGCPLCGHINIGMSRRNSQQYFIDKSNKIHNYLYDYSLSEYVKQNEAVDIICSIHGIFTQTPKDHMRCPSLP